MIKFTADASVQRTISVIAYAVAVLVAVGVPLTYFQALYRFELGALSTLTRSKARFVSEQHVNRSPHLWRFEEHRLQQHVRLEPTESPREMRYTILDADGTMLASGDERAPRSPVISDKAPLLDSGRLVGYYQVERSVHGVMLATLLAALGSSLLAVAIAVALRALPLRALRQSQERLQHMAHHDALTGLPNRALLEDRLEQAILHCRRYGRCVTVAYLDLDNFKTINDTLGHNAGDALLRMQAQRMANSVRNTDTVVRIGGDEFVLILFDQPNESENIAGAIKRLQSSIAGPLQLEGHTIKVTASIGLATFPGDGEDAGALLMNADAAMYAAKAAGRDNFQFFTKELNQKAHERLAMQEALVKASRDEHFFLVYQPQVDVDSGQMIAVEALIRWRHPEWGMVSPAKFIPLAEESGLIVQIGQWVLRTACSQNKRWQEQGMRPIVMSVNVSARQFKDKRFVDDVRAALDATGLEPQWLELELTESLIMQDVDQAIATMSRLASMGVKLSIDDFGTGYSSLSALKHFPVTRLKIDRTFVRDIPSDEDDKSITLAVIALGHRMNLKVIAEGVETREQLLFLRENHCDEIQGYLYSKPVAATDIAMMLGRHPGDAAGEAAAEVRSADSGQARSAAAS